MVTHIHVKNHKGVSSLYLENLGQTNIICGKNSSGKSSILECLAKPDNFSVGIPLTDSHEDKIVATFFNQQAKRYSNPSPNTSQSWFLAALQDFRKGVSTVYRDDLHEFISHFSASQKSNPNLRNHSIDIFNFAQVFDSFIESNVRNPKTILVPPKRNYPSRTTIDLGQSLAPDGHGLVNKLFFLKNHDLGSNEFICYRKIHDVFSDITQSSFNIIPGKENGLILKFQVDGKWLEAEQCGLGFKDILHLITFILVGNYDLYMIEEPESHLHADFQKRLLQFLKSLPQKQFILSTHSNVFVDPYLVDKIYYCWFDGQVRLSDKTSISKIIDSLGYSVTENLSCDAIVLTEGPSDIPIIKRILVLNNTLNNSNIKFWPLGGDIMGSLDLSLFSTKNVFAFVDSDPGSSKIRKEFIKNCKEHKVHAFQLQRYAIENYLPLHLIRQVFPGQISDKLTELSFDIPVDEQIGFKAKGKSIKGKNNLIAQNLTKEHLIGSDLWKYAEEIRKQINARE